MLVRRIHDLSTCIDMGHVKRLCVVGRLKRCNMTVDPEACLQHHRLSHLLGVTIVVCAYDTAVWIYGQFDMVEPRGVGDLEEVSGGGTERDFGEDLCPLERCKSTSGNDACLWAYRCTSKV